MQDGALLQIVVLPLSPVAAPRVQNYVASDQAAIRTFAIIVKRGGILIKRVMLPEHNVLNITSAAPL